MIIETNQIPPGYGGSMLVMLCYLAEHGPNNMTELSEAAHVTTAAMTSLVDRAEAARVAFRKPNPNDRRQWIVEITDIGAAIVAKMQPAEEVGA